jgi:hypothetical protein
MATIYAECESYRDSGVVTTVFFESRGQRTVKRPFTTAFVRPDRLRYEFLDRRGEEEFDRYLVWRAGEEIRTWWDVNPGVEHESSLERALAGATGVSGGSAYTIPGFLLPDELNGSLAARLRDPEVLANGEIGGARCHRIRGIAAGGARPEPVTYWIEAESKLLRRIEEQMRFDDFGTVETTDYEAEIDVPIDASLLAFDPPAEDGR